ncbi:MAG: CpsD/CapB family tyrosine-protein kinase [Aliidongia sp.]
MSSTSRARRWPRPCGAFRAKLRWSPYRPPLKALLVTSVLPGEGKTSFALALARLAARDGCKTLLIECDFRRPSLEDALSRPAEPGLPVFLEEPDQWRECVETDRLSGLDYLTAPRYMSRISPYLDSDALQMIMAEARRDYDLVVIDSPPIMRVPDAMLLGPRGRCRGHGRRVAPHAAPLGAGGDEPPGAVPPTRRPASS